MNQTTDPSQSTGTADNREHPPSRSNLLLRRLAALSYDSLVMLGFLMVATFPYLGLLHLLTGSDETAVGDPLFRFYLIALIYSYVWFSWRRGGQTIGMKAWRLQAASNDTGERLGHGQIARRFFLGIPAFFLFGAGYWMSLLHPQGLTLQEWLSGSHSRVLPKQR